MTVVVAGLLWAWRRDDPAEPAHGDCLVAAGLARRGSSWRSRIVLAVDPEHSSALPAVPHRRQRQRPGAARASACTGGHRWEPLLLFARDGRAGRAAVAASRCSARADARLARRSSSNEAYWQTYFHYDVLLVPRCGGRADRCAGAAPPASAPQARVVGLAAFAARPPASAWSSSAGPAPLLEPDAYRLSAAARPPRRRIAAQLTAGRPVAVPAGARPRLRRPPRRPHALDAARRPRPLGGADDGRLLAGRPGVRETGVARAAQAGRARDRRRTDACWSSSGLPAPQVVRLRRRRQRVAPVTSQADERARRPRNTAAQQPCSRR